MRSVKYIASLLLSFLLLATTNLRAQDKGRYEFRQALQAMKTLKRYSYTARIEAGYPNQQPDRLEVTLYLDKSSQQLYYTSELLTLLISGGIQMHADHVNKEITFIRSSGLKTGNQNFFENDMMDLFLDSFLIKDAVLQFEALSTNVWRFNTTFPEEHSIRKFTMDYDHQAKMPKKIYIEARYAAPDDNKTLIYRVTCSDYQSAFPPAVFQTSKYFEQRAGKMIRKKYLDYKDVQLQ